MNTAPAWLEDLDAEVLDAAIERLQRLMVTGGTVVIAAHVGPDGDALGATLALHHALKARGVRTLPTVGEEPLRVPASLGVLPGSTDLVPAASLPPAAEVDLLVTVDAASPDRLGSIAGYLDGDVPTIMIDHHASGRPFGTWQLVAPSAAATVQLVAEIFERLGVQLTSDVATCLYVGLVTDTGRFGHSNTDSSAMALAGQLLDVGIDHTGLTRRLFGTRSLGELRLLGAALERLEFLPDVAMVTTYITPEELAASGSGPEATEALIEVVRSADIAEVALVLKPGGDGIWRGSMRSRGGVDVGAVATALGGGGHAAASGFTTQGTPDEVVAKVATLLREPGGQEPS